MKFFTTKYSILRLMILVFSFTSIQLFAQNKPLKLWYQAPASQWEASLPLGNGRLGAMPDGGVFNEKIVLNDITLWSGGKQKADNPEANQYLPEIQKLLLTGKNIEAQALMSKYFKCLGKGSGEGNGADVPYGSYQLLANLDIKYRYETDSAMAQIKGYERQLILDSATASTKYTINQTTYKREYLTSFDDDVIAIKLSASQLKKVSFSLSLSRPERSTSVVTSNILQLSGQLNNGTDGKGMQYTAMLAIKNFGGRVNYHANSIDVAQADSAIIYIAAGTDFERADYKQFTKSTLEKALTKKYDLLRRNHIVNFRKLFAKASLHIEGNGNDLLPTDQRLASFITNKSDNALAALYFQYGRYLAISSTRPGLLPPNLQGLWANTIQTPWNGDYHLDINIQMNEWPLEVTNLGSLNEPYFDLVKGLVKPGMVTAKAYYNAKGWVAHVITNIWGYTSPGEDYSWGAYNTGSAWLCQMLWNHYQYSNDKEYLAKLYPIIKGSAEFYLDMLITEPTHGWLVTAPSNSPENAFRMKDGKVANVCIGPTIDNQLIRFLFKSVIAASETLNKDAVFAKKLKDAVKKLPPDQIGKDGRLMEWLEEYQEPEPHHRHTSHLWGLYPGNEISIKTPALANAAKASLQMRGDDGTGWSLAWKMNFWARLHDGDHALLLFQKLLRPVTTNKVAMNNGGGSYPNLFCAHPPFQIDGNFGGTAGIAEMLLQSEDGFIELLPALPTEWKTGSFAGWRARGGAEVSAKWRNSKLTLITITAITGRKFQIKVPKNSMIKAVKNAGKSLPIHLVQTNLQLRLKAGETVEITFKNS